MEYHPFVGKIYLKANGPRFLMVSLGNCEIVTIEIQYMFETRASCQNYTGLHSDDRIVHEFLANCCQLPINFQVCAGGETRAEVWLRILP